ncbi:uncharacterized protein LOC117341065 [Pecten maximus]|uniref:uncharacterized protein LOC117341065 n=1 Tax=Pecten maximus TaxID=6579 RepID=UPI001458B1FB|nr:uncharacterized protein LOC117341065 [Pecten maximus]
MRVLIFILGLSSALAALDTTAEILAAVDKSFIGADGNHDGLLELDELLQSYVHVDGNGDGRISENEFESRSTNHTYTRVVFMMLDYDGDGYLDTSSVYGQYSVMDSNGDNEVSRREFDVYYSKIMIDAIDTYGYLVDLQPIHQ